MGPYVVFPIILGCSLAIAIALEPRVGAAAALMIAEGLGALAIITGERRLTYRPAWLRSHGDVATDVAHALISGIGTTQLLRMLVQAGGVVLAGALSAAFGATLWPDSWPLLAQLALALVLAELPQYWLHRWQHEKDALWRFHAVHHSAPRLYWLNAARFHPVDLGLLYLVGYLPLIALGAPITVIMLFTLFDAVFGMFQHSTIAMRLGPLNYLFSAGEPHRWHHSRKLEEANSNYGSNLLVWDAVFGTLFLPSRREPPVDIGIADMPDFPQTYVAQLAAPFRRRNSPRGTQRYAEGN
jgi:sterol desaturase/sphingolipid hydroxylase (fatty acid hydroxylase superfamily)